MQLLDSEEYRNLDLSLHRWMRGKDVDTRKVDPYVKKIHKQEGSIGFREHIFYAFWFAYFLTLFFLLELIYMCQGRSQYRQQERKYSKRSLKKKKNQKQKQRRNNPLNKVWPDPFTNRTPKVSGLNLWKTERVLQTLGKLYCPQDSIW